MRDLLLSPTLAFEVGFHAGIPAERLNDVLNDIRKEDGVCQ